MYCPRCGSTLTELQMTYLDYVALTPTERALFVELCNDENTLKELSTTYRMYKYSKWYRDMMAANASQEKLYAAPHPQTASP
jgi:hypothetical protein